MLADRHLEGCQAFTLFVDYFQYDYVAGQVVLFTVVGGRMAEQALSGQVIPVDDCLFRQTFDDDFARSLPVGLYFRQYFADRSVEAQTETTFHLAGAEGGEGVAAVLQVYRLARMQVLQRMTLSYASAGQSSGKAIV